MRIKFVNLMAFWGFFWKLVDGKEMKPGNEVGWQFSISQDFGFLYWKNSHLTPKI